MCVNTWNCISTINLKLKKQKKKNPKNDGTDTTDQAGIELPTATWINKDEWDDYGEDAFTYETEEATTDSGYTSAGTFTAGGEQTS